MKIEKIELQHMGVTVSSDLSNAKIRSLVSQDLKAKGVPLSAVGDVQTYVNVDSGKATLHYVSGEVIGSVKL